MWKRYMRTMKSITMWIRGGSRHLCWYVVQHAVIIAFWLLFCEPFKSIIIVGDNGIGCCNENDAPENSSKFDIDIIIEATATKCARTFSKRQPLAAERNETEHTEYIIAFGYICAVIVCITSMSALLQRHKIITINLINCPVNIKTENCVIKFNVVSPIIIN